MSWNWKKRSMLFRFKFILTTWVTLSILSLKMSVEKLKTTIELQKTKYDSKSKTCSKDITEMKNNLSNLTKEYKEVIKTNEELNAKLKRKLFFYLKTYSSELIGWFISFKDVSKKISAIKRILIVMYDTFFFVFSKSLSYKLIFNFSQRKSLISRKKLKHIMRSPSNKTIKSLKFSKYVAMKAFWSYSQLQSLK